MNENSFSTEIAAWGPSLVMLVAVLIAGIIAWRLAEVKSKVSMTYAFRRDSRGDELALALEAAEATNAYSLASGGNPDVHLSEIVRVSPSSYREATGELPAFFLAGRIISIDMSAMSAHEAARLVDFCSGMLAGGLGWIFRVTDHVLVLTPTTRAES
jgi:FtsZ-interacting cell division protein YlmF